MRHPRVAIAALSLSAAGFVSLVVHEGYTDRAIVPVKGDRPTVGFGSTFRDDGTPVQMGDTITAPRAVQRSFNHIAKDEAGLKSCVTGQLSQVEYDTLVDFAYQYGVPATCRSPMVRHINAGEYAKACQAYREYRFMTSSSPIAGWEPFRFDSAGKPTRWRFDCSTPGNRTCMGVWLRQKARIDACMAAQ